MAATMTKDSQEIASAEAFDSLSAGVRSIALSGSKLIPGSVIQIIPEDESLAEEGEGKAHTVSKTSAANFNVRAANYKKLNKKEPSLTEFYELVSCDLLKSEQVVEHVASYLKLNQVAEGEGDQAKGVAAESPTFFIVNCQLPDDEPSMFGSFDDGPGRSAVFIFKVKPETIEAFQAISKDPSTASPSLKLLSEYFNRAPIDADFRGRFKVIASVKNMEALDLPGFIQNYNGKPVLITKSGTLFKGDNYLEMDIRVHRFSYLAKKGLSYLQSKFSSMIFDVGFVIEGRSDEELPEQMLAAARLIRLDYEKAVEFDAHLVTSVEQQQKSSTT